MMSWSLVPLAAAAAAIQVHHSLSVLLMLDFNDPVSTVIKGEVFRHAAEALVVILIVVADALVVVILASLML